MKKAGKIFVYLVITLVIIIGAALSYVKFSLPDVGPAPELKVEATPERIERGKYLSTHVAVCIDCHSTRDWSKFSAPLEGTIGGGGEKFDHSLGIPGNIYSANITPHNLKSWTDGELFRAITTGVKKDGSAIFPIMPYAAYGKMSNEDIYSIIAFIRTLPEQQTSSPARELDFPLNFLVNTMPALATPSQIPDVSKTVEYGAYMLNAAACFDCHTNVKDGKPLEGMDYAGGREFKLPSGGAVYSANITPDKETGIGKFTKDDFIGKFRVFSDSTHQLQIVKKNEFQTIMPWTMYAGMNDVDLGAIYAYLQTIKPINNQVTKFVAGVN